MKSIPKILYPIALDSDYTLFSTHNSSQSVLAENVDKTSEVINMVAQMQTLRIFGSDNGFITIENELIYYDSVSKNENSKIYQFKDCIRGVEGDAECYLAGTFVTSNVIAQTHNQLVDVIIAIEDAIGDVAIL